MGLRPCYSGKACPSSECLFTQRMTTGTEEALGANEETRRKYSISDAFCIPSNSAVIKEGKMAGLRNSYHNEKVIGSQKKQVIPDKPFEHCLPAPSARNPNVEIMWRLLLH